MFQAHGRLHNPLTRDFGGAYEMALALSYPEGVTRDELARQFALFVHIHTQNERADFAAVRRRLAKEAAGG